jgi:hypothetical protein
MAEGDIVFYNVYLTDVLRGTLDHDTDSMKVILVSGYTPDYDNDTQYADVTTYEYSTGSGYTAGGVGVTTPVISQDDTNDMGVLNIDDPSWSNLGPLSPAQPTHAIGYFDTDDVLIMTMELGTTPTNGQDYTLQVHTNGWINVKNSA